MRKAEIKDLEQIDRLIKLARASLKNDGIDQWQKTKPNRALVEEQIKAGLGFVMEEEDGTITAYAKLNDIPEDNYELIADKWQTKDYIIIHTMASDTTGAYPKTGTRFMGEIISFAKAKGKDGLRIDTHDENFRMKGLLQKYGYRYVGVVQIDEDGVGRDRNAYELIF